MSEYELKEELGNRNKAFTIVYQVKNDMYRIALVDKEGNFNFCMNLNFNEDEVGRLFSAGSLDMNTPRFYPTQKDMIKFVELLEIKLLDRAGTILNLDKEICNISRKLKKEQRQFFPYWLRKLFGAK